MQILQIKTKIYIQKQTYHSKKKKSNKIEKDINKIQKYILI